MMKAESSNLVYIIISVVLLIVSAIRKNKNKNQTAPRPVEDSPTPQAPWQRELENVFGKIIGEEPEIEKTYPQRELLTTEKEPVKTLQFEMSPIYSNFQNGSLKPFENLSVISVSNQQDGGYLKGINDLDENEIRKAIIYSEIINRKYF